MKQKTNSTSIKIIYWMTQIVFWFFSVVGSLATVFAFLLIFNLVGNPQLHMGMPLETNVKEISEVVLNGQVVEVELKEMTGKIHFVDTPLFIARTFAFTMLIALGLAFYGLLTFRKFIINVYYGQFFERSNILLLKRIAYVILSFWIYSILFVSTQYLVLINKLKFETVEFNLDMNWNGGVLMAALFIWVLSHIFLKGAELKEENELTV